MHNIVDKQPIYIRGCGFNSALGCSNDIIHQRLRQGISPDMQVVQGWLNDGSDTVIGKVSSPLPIIDNSDFPHQNTKNNRLALSALQQIEPEINAAIAQYGCDRIAVIVGTTTSGISDGEHALTIKKNTHQFSTDYHYYQQEPSNTGQFIADYYQLTGPCYTLSTACSSSGRVFLSAKRMLKAGVVDAVIVGGADTLCRLTLNGFHGLNSLSSTLCNPFSDNRDGINIGEGAAFMLLANTPDVGLPAPHIALLGVGNSSDAHHISAPHPEGTGAETAMRKALEDAKLTPEDIGYINAHGTATPLNDAMEAKAIARVFGNQVPVSSTKPLTGHTLGAASAIEAAICWHLLRYDLPLPTQINDGVVTGEMSIQLAPADTTFTKPVMLSNSFAFGGNNISLIIGRIDD